MFITGEDGVVNTYRLGDITEAANQVNSNTNKVPSISSNKVLQAIEFGNVDISSHFGDETSAATTYYSESENALYVADCAGDGSLIKYSVTVGGKGVSFDKGTVISRNFASCCQGVATYTDPHGNNYIYASQSYGANHDSVIKKYEIIDTGLKEVGATTIDTPGLEGIQIDKQGNLSGVFENFKDTDNPNQTININVNTIDFSKPLSETNPELEEFYIEMGTKNKEKLN